MICLEVSLVAFVLARWDQVEKRTLLNGPLDGTNWRACMHRCGLAAGLDALSGESLNAWPVSFVRQPRRDATLETV